MSGLRLRPYQESGLLTTGLGAIVRGATRRVSLMTPPGGILEPSGNAPWRQPLVSPLCPAPGSATEPPARIESHRVGMRPADSPHGSRTIVPRHCGGAVSPYRYLGLRAYTSISPARRSIALTIAMKGDPERCQIWGAGCRVPPALRGCVQRSGTLRRGGFSDQSSSGYKAVPAAPERPTTLECACAKCFCALRFFPRELAAGGAQVWHLSVIVHRRRERQSRGGALPRSGASRFSPRIDRKVPTFSAVILSRASSPGIQKATIFLFESLS